MKQILLRKVPEELHKKLKMGAAQAGKPMQDFIVEILTAGMKEKK